MRAVLLVYRGELRRRWRSLVMLALLVAVAGGAVLSAWAAGRRTASAFPSFVARYGYNAALYSPRPLTSFAGLPDVRSVVAVDGYLTGNIVIGGRIVPADDITMVSASTKASGHLFRLLSGRLPSPTSTSDVVASFTLAQQYGVHIGSVLEVPFYAASQAASAFATNGTLPTHGPTLALRVVGLEANPNDFEQPSYTLVVGPRFQQVEAPRVVVAYDTVVGLRDGNAGVARFMQAAAHLRYAYAQDYNATDASVEGSIHPQAVGWWLLAVLAALAGLAVVGQAFARQALVQAESYSPLRALGVGPSQLFSLALATAATAATAGALGAVALAWALSPLTPVGEARYAAAQGFLFDPFVLPIGGVGVLVLTMGLAAVPAWRTAHSHATIRRRPAGGVAPAIGPLRAAGASPSALIGTRRALERGSGRSRLPLATALLGTTLAVTALVTTAVFGASLSTLTKTPRLYGEGWQLALVGKLTGAGVQATLPSIARTPGVARIAYAYAGGFLNTGSVTVHAVLVNDVRGAEPFPIVSGHFPSGDDQIVLGETTLKEIGAHIGSVIPVAAVTQSVGRPVPFTVVGTASFNPNLGTGGMGIGAITTLDGGLNAACGSGARSQGCRLSVGRALKETEGWGIVVSGSPGVAGQRALRALEHRFPNDLGTSLPPATLVNFGQAVDFPLLLGIILALLGAAMFAHLLVVSVARRRRDVALLKALGFVRRQVAGAVCWHASAVAVVAVGFGVPVGIALGRLVWRTFAINFGAVPLEVVPGWLIVALAGGVLLVANLLALVPALTASRLRPTEALATLSD